MRIFSGTYLAIALCFGVAAHARGLPLLPCARYPSYVPVVFRQPMPHFNIPPAPLEQQLRAWSAQGQIEIDYDGAMLPREVHEGLKIQCDAAAALQRLLSGTGFGFDQPSGWGKVTVVPHPDTLLEYHIPPGDLWAVLEIWARQTHVTALLLRTPHMDVPGLQGAYPAIEALGLLLQQTGIAHVALPLQSASGVQIRPLSDLSEAERINVQDPSWFVTSDRPPSGPLPEIVVSRMVKRNASQPPPRRASMPFSVRACQCAFYFSFGLRISLPGVCDDDEGHTQFDQRCDGRVSKVWR